MAPGTKGQKPYPGGAGWMKREVTIKRFLSPQAGSTRASAPRGTARNGATLWQEEAMQLKAGNCTPRQRHFKIKTGKETEIGRYPFCPTWNIALYHVGYGRSPYPFGASTDSTHKRQTRVRQDLRTRFNTAMQIAISNLEKQHRAIKAALCSSFPVFKIMRPF